MCDGDPETFWVSRREEPAPGTGPTPERPEVLTFAFARQERVGTVMLVPRPRYGPRRIRLQVGTTTVYEGPVPDAPREFPVNPPVPAASAVLTITDSHDPAHPDAPRNTQIAEVAFGGAPTEGAKTPDP